MPRAGVGTAAGHGQAAVSGEQVMRGKRMAAAPAGWARGGPAVGGAHSRLSCVTARRGVLRLLAGVGGRHGEALPKAVGRTRRHPH